VQPDCHAASTIENKITDDLFITLSLKNKILKLFWDKKVIRSQIFVNCCVKLSARGKDELSSAQKMDVQMKNGLAAVIVRIDHDAVSFFGKTLTASDLGGGQKQLAERFPVALSRLVERGNVLARDQQNMRRSLRVDVVKSHAKIVFVNFFRRNIARNDFAKNTIFTHIRKQLLNHKAGQKKKRERNILPRAKGRSRDLKRFFVSLSPKNVEKKRGRGKVLIENCCSLKVLSAGKEGEFDVLFSFSERRGSILGYDSLCRRSL
jgi:hypothetical protein